MDYLGFLSSEVFFFEGGGIWGSGVRGFFRWVGDLWVGWLLVWVGNELSVFSSICVWMCYDKPPFISLYPLKSHPPSNHRIQPHHHRHLPHFLSTNFFLKFFFFIMGLFLGGSCLPSYVLTTTLFLNGSTVIILLRIFVRLKACTACLALSCE